MEIHDPLHDGQAEPGARLLRGDEGFEGPLCDLRRDPGSVVRHGNQDIGHESKSLRALRWLPHAVKVEP